jgi:hypothetical protein
VTSAAVGPLSLQTTVNALVTTTAAREGQSEALTRYSTLQPTPVHTRCDAPLALPSRDAVPVTGRCVYIQYAFCTRYVRVLLFVWVDGRTTTNVFWKPPISTLHDPYISVDCSLYDYEYVLTPHR